MKVHKPEICTCGHPAGAHFEGVAPIKDLAYACSFKDCKCKRYDRRNFTDAELEQLAIDHLEQQRAKLQAAARSEPPAAPPASTEPDPMALTLDGRRVLALERIGAALGRLVDHLERVDRRANPCPAGGNHRWVYVDARISRCERCPAELEKGPSA